MPARMYVGALLKLEPEILTELASGEDQSWPQRLRSLRDLIDEALQGVCSTDASSGWARGSELVATGG